MPGEANNWIVLRCKGSETLRIAGNLAKREFDVWTPRETRRIRIPKFNVDREAVLPLMASYVFARASHLVELIQLAENLTAGSFSVMRAHDRFPVIKDHHLNGLRTLEAKRTPRKKAPPLPPGVSIRVGAEGGAFTGMKGRVERSNEKTTLVCFDRRMTVEIATSLLSLDDLRVERPLIGMAA